MYTLTNLFLVVILITITISQNIDEPCVNIKTNVSGICKLSNNCPQVDILTKRGVQVQLCGFHLNILPIFCCTEGGENLPSVTPSPSPSPEPPQPTSPSSVIITAPVVDEAFANNYIQQKCVEYSANVTNTVYYGSLEINAQVNNVTESKCDKNALNLISEGTEAMVKEFPCMALLGIKSNDNKIEWGFCGGALINDRFVLTAAHCLTSSEKNINIVRLGELNIASDKDGSKPEDYTIMMKYIHENYRPPSKYNDIALLKLNERVFFTDFIKPACLWTKPTQTLNNSIAIGWGATSFDSPKSDKLLKVSLQIYDNLVCQERYSTSLDREQFPRGVRPNTICAGDLRSAKDTCQGDSGGPLITIDENNPCIQHIIGITSVGKPCGNILGNNVAIYTRVSSYLSWIVNKIQ